MKAKEIADAVVLALRLFESECKSHAGESCKVCSCNSLCHTFGWEFDMPDEDGLIKIREEIISLANFKENSKRKIYFPVGTVFNDGDTDLQVVEGDECDGCYYNNNNVCCNKGVFLCGDALRRDRKKVIFEEVNNG